MSAPRQQEDYRYFQLMKALALCSGESFDLAEMRRSLVHYGKIYPVAAGVKITRSRLSGCPAEILDPDKESRRGVLLYLHGGGFVMGSIESHRQLASRIAVSAQMKMIIIDYRLAPEHPFPAALVDCEAVYNNILEMDYRPGEIGVIGDSAGGGLCVSLMLRLKKAKALLPRACVCLSPWVDLLQRGESWATNAEYDVLVDRKNAAKMADFYLNSQNPCVDEISPVYADLSGLPEMLIHASSSEVLLDDAKMLYRRAKDCGLSAHLKIWPNVPHVCQFVAPVLKEGRDAIAEIGLFLKKRLLTD